MAAAGHPGEDANLFDTVKAVGDELCRDIGVAIPVGKDSMSMRTRWEDENGEHQVVAPVSLIVTAFAPVTDVTKHLTPQLRETEDSSYSGANSFPPVDRSYIQLTEYLER